MFGKEAEYLMLNAAAFSLQLFAFCFLPSAFRILLVGLRKILFMPNDTRIFSIINKELNRQREGIELIASENFTSAEVIKAMGSVLSNKYAEGYPGKRYYGGGVHWVGSREHAIH